jgi:phosphate transport system permease protein
MEKSANTNYQRWRLAKDSFARFGVIAGGLSVIVALVLIFFYLLYVVVPLFKPASAEAITHYPVPEQNLGKTVLLDVEEQNEVAARFTETGQAIFFEVATGKVILTEAIKTPTGVQVTSFSQGSPINEGAVIYGLSNGTAVVVKHQYKTTYPNDKRLITPSLRYPLGETPIVVDNKGAAIKQIAVRVGEKSTTVVGKTADKIYLVNLESEKNLMTDEVTLERSEALIEAPATDISDIRLDKEGRNLFLFANDGSLSFFDISDKSAPELKQHLNVVEAGAKITVSTFLNGDNSLLIGDSKGLVAQWAIVRDAARNPAMQRIRAFKVSEKAIATIDPEPRRKGFVAIDSEGKMGVYHTTAEREVMTEQVAQATPIAAA